uniref:Uncharacterized protein n=1 Tax=Arundo donax TaxID=35708 RepID=A0A0A9BQK3_ARUDO
MFHQIPRLFQDQRICLQDGLRILQRMTRQTILFLLHHNLCLLHNFQQISFQLVFTLL